MRKFNEGTNVVATVNFRDPDGAATPTNVYYTLRNATANKTVVDWTSVTPGSEVEIDIAADYVAIEDRCNDREVQELTVAADYGLDTQVPHTLRWTVVNLGAL